MPQNAISACRFLLLVLSLTAGIHGYGQHRCLSSEMLKRKLQANPALKALFESREAAFQKEVQRRIASGRTMRSEAIQTVPVVFHLVLSNQSQVTDVQVLAQLDTLNRTFAGTNTAPEEIPAHFRALAGQSGIRFCLAQRTPDGKPTTGIVRYTASRARFIIESEEIKHASSGGADAWDTGQYLNVWVGNIYSTLLREDVLGYASFPGEGKPEEHGIAILPSTLPGGNSLSYNQGKTLTHEAGHFFNLYHIWGDDDGACFGTDYIDDTPNQADFTATCRSGIVTDNCTRTSPGIMYQNFMDYSPDRCLRLFTVQQVARMEAAFSTYRASLGRSMGCVPVNLKTNDATLYRIDQPSQRVCTDTFIPEITLQNNGSAPLLSLKIAVRVDDEAPVVHDWSGNLAYGTRTTLKLPRIGITEGRHRLTAYTYHPNGKDDENTPGDTLTIDIVYSIPATAPLKESFEAAFPADGWDLLGQPATGWERTTLAARTGIASARIRNFTNTAVGQHSYLRSRQVTLTGADSAFVAFDLAAATSAFTTGGTAKDTLEVLVSTDCGNTYTTVLKKWGESLGTTPRPVQGEYTPVASDWQKTEIDISDFIRYGEVLVAFLGVNGNGNNIYLDNINIRTVTVNPFAKEKGFLVNPNPVGDVVTVSFYPHPEGLQRIEIVDVAGRKVAETVISNSAESGVYEFGTRSWASGVYIVRAVFDSKVYTAKIVKL